jgi:AcrR family transcriptional regulator
MNTRPLTRRQRHRQRTRWQLQSALVELIMEKGYDAVSIQDVTERADLARATFYLHARDKDELLWSVIEDMIHSTEAEVTRIFAGPIPPQAEYYGYWNIFKHIEKNQDIYRVILGSKGSSLMAHRVHEYMVAETLKDMQRLGIYSDFNTPLEITAQVIIGSILSLAIWWLETPNDYTPQQMGEMTYEALHHKTPPTQGFG